MKSALLSFAVALFLSSGALAQDYQIQLLRPMKAGERYQVAVSGTQSQAVTVTSNGNTLKDSKDEFTVDYKSVEQILEVDPLGRETKASSTIEKITKTQGGASMELLPKGTVVVSSIEGGKQIHEINGQPVDPDVAKVLNMVISMSKGGPLEDDAFGTKDRKKKGETWDANVTALQDYLTASMEGKAENFAGKGMLVNVVKDSGGDVLQLTVHVTGKMAPPLPQGFIVDDSAFEATFGGNFPVNIALGRPRDTQAVSLALSAHADTPSGEKVVLKLKATTSLVHSQTRL